MTTTPREEFFDALAQFMSPRTDDIPMDALSQFAQLRYARQGVDFVFNAKNATLEPPPPLGKDAEMRPGVYRQALVKAWRQAAARLLKHHGFNRWADVSPMGVAMYFSEVNAGIKAPLVLIRFDTSDQSVSMAIMGVDQKVDQFAAILDELGKKSIAELDSFLHREDPSSYPKLTTS